MTIKKLNKKQREHATAYQCLNEDCKRQIALVEHFIICPICEKGGLEIVSDSLPF